MRAAFPASILPQAVKEGYLREGSSQFNETLLIWLALKQVIQLSYVFVTVTSDDPEGDSPATRVLRNQIAKHYLLVWASILTLPEGWQLDLWLCLMLFMDSWPLVYGIFR